jgi:low affinity Fe/Cu permease
MLGICRCRKIPWESKHFVHERDLAVIHSKWDDTAYAKVDAEDKVITIEDAIARALEE